jgi:hypothetical protein
MKIEGLPVIEVDESEEIAVAVRADDLLEGDMANPKRHPIAIAKLVRTYNRNTYENEKRTALNNWAQHLKVIVAQATGANVTALKKKG